MAKIVFMGTPDFAVPSLQALIDSGQLVGVVTQPDRPAGRGKSLRPPPVKEVAEAAGIPVYQPKSLRKESAAAPLYEWVPDLIVVAAFGQILRPHVLNLPPLGCVNVHASLLPRWRGASPIQHAILAGDTHTGVTLMQMDVGLDTGAMLVTEKIEIRADETAASLHDRLAELGGHMMQRYLDDLLQQRFEPVPQDDDLSTYAPMISKDDGRLDWSRTAAELDRQIRAMTPWPGAFTDWDGQLLKVLQASPINDSKLTDKLLGEVVEYDDKVVVAAAEGSGLILEQIQLAGKKAVAAADFVRGRPQFIGTQLA